MTALLQALASIEKEVSLYDHINCISGPGPRQCLILTFSLLRKASYTVRFHQNSDYSWQVILRVS